MRIFKTKEFDRVARRERLTDLQLRQAVSEIEDGLVDADLGSNLFKKRIAHRNQGKRSAFRTLLAFRSGKKTFFLYCFSKSERGNVSPKEKQALKILSKQYLKLSDDQINHAKLTGALVEIEANQDE